MTEVLEVVQSTPTTKERELVKALSNPEAKIDVVVPEDINPKEWMTSANAVCSALLRADKMADALFLALGRLLVIARQNEAIYIENGYENFDAFLSGAIRDKFGYERASCYEAMALAKRWSQLDLGTFKAIGRVKFRVLKKAIPAAQVNESWAKTLVQKAAKVTESALVEYCEEKKYLSPGETKGTTITIRTNKSVAKQWEKFIGNSHVQAYCESEDPARILVCMMDECLNHWESMVEESGAAEAAAK